MTALIKNIELTMACDAVWDAICDFGNVHERLVPGFLTASRMDGDARIVTFANAWFCVSRWSAGTIRRDGLSMAR